MTQAANVGSISGTGPGLIIARRAVELHNGTIAIESKVGRETTITVEIPFDTQKGK
ncbi:MAG: HAMP domain-containing histidine kinase [Anaerolineae bacterium]|nr:HAMP domain-containing histidine kinase [Anaerolineae bacterium]